ncbi:MAG: NAD-dependent epimerase/dehydratase family protein [Flavobacteriaceae bacterium]
MILVTGGTGLVGSHLLLKLVNMGASVKAVYRDQNKLEGVRRVFSIYSEDSEKLLEDIQWVQADLTDLPSLEKAFEDVRHVYHCAAMISFDPNDFQALVQTNETGTANLVNLCVAKKIQKLCYVSSIAAIGKNPNSAMVDEENEWRSTNANPYALTKHLAEMEVWRGTQEGVPAVIVNPGVIIGPGFWDSGSGRLFRVAARGSKYHPPGGSGFVCVDDVVLMMTELMNSKIENERFIAVAENLSYQQVLAKLARNLGRTEPSVEIPFWLLNILWRLDWIWHAVSGRKRKLSQAQVTSLRDRTYYQNEKAREVLGFEYQSLDECMLFSSKIFKESNPALSS